jgi:hypothetical protein
VILLSGDLIMTMGKKRDGAEKEIGCAMLNDENINLLID